MGSLIHRCPICSGTDLLIYGTHTAPQGCELCQQYKNQDQFTALKVQMHNAWAKRVEEMAKEMAVGIKARRAAGIHWYTKEAS